MEKVLEKYYRLNKDYRDELENLYVFKVLQEEIERHKNLEFDIGSKECLFNISKTLFENSNIKAQEIIERLLNILECRDVELYEIDELNLDELIELVENKDTDFKLNYKEREFGD